MNSWERHTLIKALQEAIEAAIPECETTNRRTFEVIVEGIDIDCEPGEKMILEYLPRMLATAFITIKEIK